MKLILHNFRCYKDAEINFEPGIMLLRGDSGAGKTTILEAFDYVFYGKIKKQYTDGATFCSVKICFGDELWVQRNSGKPTKQQGPILGKLQLFLKEKTYFGDDAQSIINQMFGTREMFLASTYLKQGKRSGLMDGTNAQKMALIRSISFQDQNVEEIQEKIKMSLKTVQSEMKALENSVFVAKTQLDAFDTNNPNVRNLKLTDVENVVVSDLAKEVELLSKSLPAKVSRYAEVATLESTLTAQKNFIAKFQNPNPSDGNGGNEADLDANLVLLQKELSELRAAKAVQASLQKNIREKKDSLLQLQKELKSLESQMGLDATIVDVAKEYERIQKNDPIRRQLDDILRKCGVANQGEMRSSVGTIAGNIRTLKLELGSLETDFENLLWNETQKQILVCPKCNSGLKLDDKKLVLASDTAPVLRTVKNPVVTQRMINEKQQEITNNEKRKELISESIVIVTNLSKELGATDSRDDQIAKFAQLYLNLAGKLKVAEAESANEVTVAPPISDIELESKISELVSKVDQLQKQKSDLALAKRQIQQYNEMLASLKLTETALGSDVSSNLQSEIAEIKKTIVAKTKLQDDATKFIRRNSLVETWEKASNLLNQKSEKATLIATLLEKSKQIEIVVLESSVQKLNAVVKKYLDVMFPEDSITVSFKTTRDTAKGENSSMTCSFNIFYKNMNYSDPDQLSSGEADRVSLAMTLAMNSLIGSTLLLLDETLNTLDRNAKITIVELLRTFCGDNKMCLVVSHEGVEGVYDNTMNIEAK